MPISIIIAPATHKVPVTKTRSYTATVKDAFGATITDAIVTWSVVAGGGTISPTAPQGSPPYVATFTAGAVPGTYTNTVRAVAVKGSVQATGFATAVVFVPGKAAFAASPAGGLAPLTVQFNNQSEGTDITFAWDFDNSGGAPDSTDVNPSFTYVTGGNFTAKLSVTGLDDNANVVTVNATQTIQVIRALFAITKTSDSSVIASAGATSGTVAVGTGLTFTNASEGTVSSVFWDFQGDGTIDSAASPATYTYTSGGVFQPTLTVFGPAGVSTASKLLTVLQAPSANFTASPTNGAAPLMVAFTDLSSANPTSWAWDFQNDGVTDSTIQNPIFTYTSGGNFTVKLTATNSAGAGTETKASYIRVIDAYFTATPTSGNAPLSVAFNTLPSTGTITSFIWDFTNDGAFDLVSSGPVTNIYPAGVFSVRMRANGPAGSSTIVRLNLITVNEVPVASFTASPTNGAAPLTVAFTDLSSGNPTSWAWDFQNDSVTDSTVKNPTFTYTTGGDFSVKLTATNGNGSNTVTQTSYIHVIKAAFSASPSSGLAPLAVSFTNQSTGTVTLLLWDFQSDGTIDKNSSGDTTFTYTTPGSFTVTLQAVGPAGVSTAVAASPIVVNQLPQADFTANVQNGGINSNFDLYVVEDTNARVQKFTDSGVFVLKWGSAGAGDGQFSFPGRVAVDPGGNVYVADTGNRRVEKFTSSGVFLTKWGSQGAGDGQFLSPLGVAVDPSGNVYVVDAGNNRVEKFTSSGVFLTKWGSFGAGDGQFKTPVGVAVDPSGNVYVTDRDNNRVQKFTDSGVFLTKWGFFGAGDGQFQGDEGVAVDPSGNVYVTETSNNRVQKFTSSGVFLTKWGSFGTGDGQFRYPEGVAVDPSGNVYVVERDNTRVQKFTSSGVFLTKWGSAGAGNGQFNAPRGIASGQPFATQLIDLTTGLTQGQTVTYQWLTATNATVGDTSCSGYTLLSTSQNPVFTPTLGGDYDICLKVTNSTGTGVVFKLDYIRIIKADFTASPLTGNAPLSVNFTNTTTGTETSRFWDFQNDGIIDSVAVSPSFIYNTAGVYAVKLTAIGPGGTSTNSKSALITVNQVPVADFTATTATAGAAPLLVKFQDLSTGGPTSWAWDFQNDGVTDSTSPALVNFTYTTGGDFTVKLVVTNANGSSTATKTSFIRVIKADFTPSASSGIAPLNVSFTDASTGTVTARLWDLDGNGTIDSTVAAPTFQYTFGGIFNPKLTVIGPAGSSFATKQISVTQPPTADFFATPLNGVAPLIVSFTDSSTGNPTSWAWDFQNDGVTDSAVQNPSFTYTIGGDFTVKLVVTNANGSSTATKTSFIRVIKADFTASPTTGTAPLAVAFTPVNTGTVTAYLWDFQNDNSFDSVAANPSFTYTTGGNFSVRLVVIGPAGFTSVTKSNLIQVSQLPAPDFSANVTAGAAPLTVNFTDATGGNPTSWAWDFDNSGGAPDSTVQNPSFTYTTGGDFSVKLTATNGSGSASVTKPAFIRTILANFSGTPTFGGTPLAVTFTNTSTGSVTQSLWDFNADGNVDAVKAGANALDAVSNTYFGAGIRSVKLTVIGPAGVSSKLIIGYISVIEVPVANFSVNSNGGGAPLTVFFQNQSTGNPTSWAWDFDNNGSTDSSLQNPSFTYFTGGLYSVKLTVSNGSGTNTLVRFNLISVVKVDFSASSNYPNIGQTVYFYSQSSGPIASYFWDFDNNGSYDGGGPSSSWSYGSSGQRSVRLTVVSTTGFYVALTKFNYIYVNCVNHYGFFGNFLGCY